MNLENTDKTTADAKAQSVHAPPSDASGTMSVTTPLSVTTRGSRAAGVDEATFSNWRWQMSHQIRSESDAVPWVNPGDDERGGFAATKTLFNAGITPYYMALMGSDENCPVRIQALPRGSELRDPIGIDDPLEEVGHSPVPEVVHVYPDRVAFCVAQLCPVYCRYCFRKRRDDEEGLHFNRSVVDRGVAYIASQPSIRDVLVTGGDPFIASDSQIIGLAQRLREIPHVEIIRFGTRTPVTLPYRVTPELARGLAAFHPVFVNTHFNCVEELTPEAVAAVGHLVDAGIPVGNQSVLLAGVNDSEEAMLALLRGLLKARVRPYYLFHPHRIAGTAHLRVPVERGLAIMRWLRGRITGLGLPSYVIDTPGGKVPVGPDYVLGRDGEDLLLNTPRGDIWREQGVLQT